MAVGRVSVGGLNHDLSQAAAVALGADDASRTSPRFGPVYPCCIGGDCWDCRDKTLYGLRERESIVFVALDSRHDEVRGREAIEQPRDGDAVQET